MSALIPKEGRPETCSNHRESVMQSVSGKGNGLKYAITFAVAAAADGLQWVLPPFWIPISMVTALIFFVLWGWRLEVMAIFVPEAIPGVELFPSWLALAVYLCGRSVSQK
jgi:hypothetical protein